MSYSQPKRKRKRSEATLQKSLANELEKIKESTGEFAVAGIAKFLPSMPGLFIKDFGYVPMPIDESLAEGLNEIFEKVPDGLGGFVRSSLQVTASNVIFKNTAFEPALKRLVRTVQKEMACEKIIPTLHKLILYEPGACSKQLPIINKSSNKLGTLIVQLPSVFKGGDVIIRHNAAEKKVKISPDKSAYTCYYFAYFSDCKYEMTKIKSGCRLALIYSLDWGGIGKMPSAATHSQASSRLLQLLQQRYHEKFVWQFINKYSNKSLTTNGVKKVLRGSDKCILSAIKTANELLPEDVQMDIYFVKITRTVKESGNCHGGKRQNKNPHNGETCSFNCVATNEDITTEEWLNTSGEHLEITLNIDVNTDIINRKTTDFWGTYDKISCLKLNSRSIRTVLYSKNLLVMWPKKNAVQIMLQHGLGPAISIVRKYMDLAQGYFENHPKYILFRTSLCYLIEKCIHNPSIVQEVENRKMCCLLNMLVQIKDRVLANKCISEILTQSYKDRIYGLPDPSMSLHVAQLILIIGWNEMQCAPSIVGLIKQSPIEHLGNLANVITCLQENSKKTAEVPAPFLALEVTEAFMKVKSLVFASKNPKVLIPIVEMMFTFEQCAPFLKDIVNEIIQQDNIAHLLRLLLEHLNKKKLLQHPFCIGLIRLRLRQLQQTICLGKANFSWHQRNAIMPSDPEVEKFLRGPKEMFVYESFEDMHECVTWIKKHFEKYPIGKHDKRKTYQATATAEYRNTLPVAVIKKIRGIHDKTIKESKTERLEYKLIFGKLPKEEKDKSKREMVALIHEADTDDDDLDDYYDDYPGCVSGGYGGFEMNQNISHMDNLKNDKHDYGQYGSGNNNNEHYSQYHDISQEKT